jgi:hypothetical protein
VTELRAEGVYTSYIVSGEESGGTHTSRTIMLEDLRSLLRSVPADARFSEYAEAVIDENVLSKSTNQSRRRSLRYLRELYLLDKNELPFRALRDLWELDPAGQPLIAMLSALARDPALRSTADTVLRTQIGGSVASADLEQAVQKQFHHSYSQPIANKIGRNTGSSWTQSGHLQGRAKKVRVKAVATPGSVTYALLLGRLSGQRGMGLFKTLWCRALDASSAELHGLAGAASARGWIEYKRFGEVVEVGFRWLGRDQDGAT